MLRIAEHWHGSDLGLQRQGNEDNYYVRAPLFVVADGMGGAQAGEVASEMAVEAFGGGLPHGDSPAEGLVHIIESANQRIHERSRSSMRQAGMGTTVTAAYVGEESVTVAHVGDSRCYLLRGGELTRLTDDHSLVFELEKQGKLTPEQAESHPQRSVITRALGPEPNVQVDVESFEAKAGDLFLVCSDGLTSMVREDKLKPLLARNGDRPLEALGRELIAAANDAGGRDNITVILFRLEEVDGPALSEHEASAGVLDEDTREYQTFVGEAYVEPRQGVSKPQGHTRHSDEARAAGKTAVHASDAAEAEYRSSGTVALKAVRPRAQPIDESHAHGPPREAPRKRRRRVITTGRLVLLGCIFFLLSALWLSTRQVYFIGVDDEHGGVVTLYQGLPYDLPLGIQLYSAHRYTGVTLPNIPASRRAAFTDHKLRTKEDAEELVLALEQGQLNR